MRCNESQMNLRYDTHEWTLRREATLHIQMMTGSQEQSPRNRGNARGKTR